MNVIFYCASASVSKNCFVDQQKISRLEFCLFSLIILLILYLNITFINMADDNGQEIQDQILLVLNRMDDEVRANTLEQISKRKKEFINDLKIEEANNKDRIRKIANNHNRCEKALPETFMSTKVNDLLKISEVSIQSCPDEFENQWLSLMIKKSLFTQKLWFVA